MDRFSYAWDPGYVSKGTFFKVMAIGILSRVSLAFGDYSASSIALASMVGKTPGCDDPPCAARVILRPVPFDAGSFDSSDVIEQIKDRSYGGRPAACMNSKRLLERSGCLERFTSIKPTAHCSNCAPAANCLSTPISTR
jgi:hypothetical protein